MKAISRKVKLSQGKDVFLDIESYFLKSLDSLNQVIHPDKNTPIVLLPGTYELGLGGFKGLDLKDDE